MLGILLVKEIRAHALSYRFALALLLLFGLIVGSMQLLALSYERQSARFNESLRAQDERLKTLSYGQVAGGGIQVARRPSPLMVLALGLEPQMARAATYTKWDEELQPGRYQCANRLYRLFPTPDLVYIVNVAISLLAVLFTFDAVAGESEAGILRSVLANAVPRHQVLLAKWLGGYLALMAPFLLAVLAGLLLARLTTGLYFTGAEWAVSAGMVGVALLYISVFCGLGLMISTWVHRAATSLVINLLVWVLLVLVVPNMAPIMARALEPAPPASVLAAQRGLLVQEKNDELRRMSDQGGERKQFDEIVARYSLQDDKVVADHQQQVSAQLVLGVTLSRLSPSASYVHAAVGLAGNGWRDYVGLQDYNKRYRKDVDRALNELLAIRLRHVPDGDDSDLMAPVGLSILPAFAPGRSGVTEALEEGWIDLLLLAIFSGVFFLGAYRGFLRYDLTA